MVSGTALSPLVNANAGAKSARVLSIAQVATFLGVAGLRPRMYAGALYEEAGDIVVARFPVDEREGPSGSATASDAFVSVGSRKTNVVSVGADGVFRAFVCHVSPFQPFHR